MDALTENLVSTLDSLGVEILLALLAKPTTEAELLETTEAAGQPTCNRRLHRLKEAGLIEQEPGKPRAPRRRWRVRHPDETEALLAALLTLADAVEALNRSSRDDKLRQLKLGRAGRLGVRAIGA